MLTSTDVVDNPLKSTLMPNDVMDQYLDKALKLRAVLKKVPLSDHEWWLKTFDMNGNGVVKFGAASARKVAGVAARITPNYI